MKYFSSDFIDQVRSANDIVALISEDTNLKERGDRYSGLCPFPDHQEKTPSFSCSQSKQVYHCFGCQKSGDIFTYLRDRKGIDFLEAVKYLAEKANIPLPKTSQNFKKDDERTLLYDLNKMTCNFYQKELEKSSRAKKYLIDRGYAEDTIKAFKIGYAPKGNVLLGQLKTEHKKNLAYQLGLLNKKEGRFYDSYRDRVIFPITSVREQVVGFGARAFGEQLPKYINSKESKIFHKGKVFYGLNQSSLFLKQKKTALIVEGYTDLISLWQSGVKNVVATLGTALTPYHAQLLRRYVSSVVLLFDGDEAGVKAMERGCSIWLSEGFEVKGVVLPENQDPDNFVKQNGASALEDLIQKSEDLFFQILRKKLSFLKENNKSLHYLIDEMVPFLYQTKNPSLQILYKQRVLDCFGVDSKSMEKVLEGALRAYKPSVFKANHFQVEKTEILSEVSLSTALPAERILLALILDSEKILKKFLESKSINLIKTEMIHNILKKLESNYRQNTENFARLLPSMINHVKEKKWLLVDFYPALTGDKSNYPKIFQDCLSSLEQRKTQSQVGQIISEMKMNNKEEFENLEKVFDLTKERLNKKNI